MRRFRSCATGFASAMPCVRKPQKSQTPELYTDVARATRQGEGVATRQVRLDGWQGLELIQESFQPGVEHLKVTAEFGDKVSKTFFLCVVGKGLATIQSLDVARITRRFFFGEIERQGPSVSVRGATTTSCGTGGTISGKYTMLRLRRANAAYASRRIGSSAGSN